MKIPDECPVCGEFTFAGWRTLHGEARCKCGAIFQIKPTSKGDWDDVPRCKVLEKFIPLMKRYWEEESDKRMVIEDKLDRFVREHEDEVDDK
mgnify:CR=1 FL=1